MPLELAANLALGRALASGQKHAVVAADCGYLATSYAVAVRRHDRGDRVVAVIFPSGACNFVGTC